MASPRNSTESIAGHQLVEELARVLPKDYKFTVHHLSTPPTPAEPLCHPPAYLPPSRSSAQDGTAIDHGERRPTKPLRTFCEKHFLTVSIESPNSREQVLALALEIYIYTTTFSSIIFVSKADSTGYLGLLKLPKGTPSPIREVTVAFLSFLVANRRRKDKQLVVNLFARSQSQYLFPGSAENRGKHVLDDRGLVRWWCRVLNPLLDAEQKQPWERIHGYLVVPGLDDHETRAFLPRTADSATKWTLGHPLERTSPYTTDPSTYGTNIPPRCLIPTYPDDPKARYVQELEESTSERVKLTSGWKGITSLGQFWEMMAIRQECSSGRMTGFIWLVFDPPAPTKVAQLDKSAALVPTPNASFVTASDEPLRPTTPVPNRATSASLVTPTSTPAQSTQSTQSTPAKTKQRRPKKPVKKVLSGRIIPRQPRIKTHQRTHFPKLNDTPHYHWPEAGRGKVVLDDSGYKRAVELLLHLEFGTLAAATTSTARWVNEVNIGQDWGVEIVGQRELPAPAMASAKGAVNDLSSMVKRKRPAADAAHADTTATTGQSVNTIGSGLIRKKAKAMPEPTPAIPSVEGLKVNTLGAGLVRKKAKPL